MFNMLLFNMQEYFFAGKLFRKLNIREYYGICLPWQDNNQQYESADQYFAF